MSISWRQYANDHPRVVDVGLVALLLLAVAGPAVLNSDLSYTDNLGWWSALPPAVVGALALLWRRSHPRTVVVLTAVCASAAGGFGYLITPVLLAPVMIALYELAVRIPGRTTRLHYLAATASIAGSALLGDDYGYPWLLTILNPVLFLLLPVALAESTRLRHDYLSAVKARAEYAERNREEEASHRVAEERVRIARELHDVVAHHLALANAQAGTAAYLARTRPDQVQRILTELTGTTSAALRELKGAVGLLRQPDDTSSPLEPAPGLGQLPELTAAFISAGLDVDVTVEGEERRLSPGVDLTAFRIVQEALTNVTKHATTKRRLRTAGLRRGLAHHHRHQRRRTRDAHLVEPGGGIRHRRHARARPDRGRSVPSRSPPRRRVHRRDRTADPGHDPIEDRPVTIRVLIADDQMLLRATFRMLIEANPDMEVVGEAADGDEAVTLTRAHHPTVVLMDIRMPRVNGLDATTAICADPSLSATRVLILTTFETDEYVAKALRTGASGFLGKDVSADALLDGIRTVAAGDALLSPTATQALITLFLTTAEPDVSAGTAERLAVLTAREREVMILAAEGRSNAEIAHHLVVSPLTVRTHIQRAMTKLHARDRTQLVVIAYQTGLVRP